MNKQVKEFLVEKEEEDLFGVVIFKVEDFVNVGYLKDMYKNQF